MLPHSAKVLFRDRSRIEHGIGFAGGLAAGGAPNSTVDDEVRHMDPLRRQLPGHALRKAPQRELRHGEGSRLRIAFDAGRSAREKDRAMTMGDHSSSRFLPDQESSKRAYRERRLDVLRLEGDDGPPDPGPRVVDNDVRSRAEVGLHVMEKAGYLIGTGRVTGIRFAAKLQT